MSSPHACCSRCVQVPNEFQSAVRSLSDAENFIFLAASGQVDKVRFVACARTRAPRAHAQRQLHRIISRACNHCMVLIDVADIIQWCACMHACVCVCVWACALGLQVTRAIDSNWDFVHIIDRDGHTALHAAASQGHVNVATLLLSRGANPSVQDYEGYTPLHWYGACSTSSATPRHSRHARVRNVHCPHAVQGCRKQLS
ncbi:ankyrin repeat domain-containing protein [archaeon]|nr:MAG: ankyrin repeat domain-containing protein [archaeon]